MLASKELSYPVPYNDTWNILDSSKTQDYQSCPRKFFFSHVLGWRPDLPSHDLVFGEAFHLLMAELYRSRFMNLEGAYDLFMNRYRQDFGADTDADYSPKNPERVVAAMQKYIDTYAYQDLMLEPTKIEMFGQAPISDQFSISFRVDMIAKNENGSIIPFEHKTSKWNIANWADQWQMKFQIMTYAYVVNCLYGDLHKIIPIVVNGVIFQKTKIEFNRITITKNIQDLSLYLSIANSIATSIKNDFATMSITSLDDSVMPCFLPNGNSCLAYNRPCIFLDYCSVYQNPLRIAQRVQPGFRQEFWNPLEGHEVEMIKSNSIV